MTALGGVWRFDGRPDAADSCARVLSAQSIYGPDAVDTWSAGTVALGRRLNRVLPEDAFDRQPLVGGAGRFVLIANIRLDNRDELAKTLRVSPTLAQRSSDADILLSAVERWGEDCFSRLVGDYTFALWDGQDRKLLLARDALGQRPLHYHRGKGFFAFASMPKGLHALPDVHYALDEDRIAEFIVLMPERGTGTYFAGIERVEPGHFAVVTARGVSRHRHWSPRVHQIRLGGPDEYAEALRSHLDEAVRCRLRGVGDIGVSMSGGLDSTAVAATAARLLAPTSRRVIAVTAVPRKGYERPEKVPNKFLDEGAHAAAVAALYPNMEHILVRNDDQTLLDRLDSLFFSHELPILSLNNAGLAFGVQNAMRARKLTISLNGSLGNFGLSFDGIEFLPELMRRGRLLRWWREVRPLVRPDSIRWRGALGLTFGPWCPPWLWSRIRRLVTGHADEVADYTAINPRMLKELGLQRRARSRGLDFRYRPWKDGVAVRLWSLQRIDGGNGYLGTLAHAGLDTRDPTADVRLLEFCLGVPMEQFLRNGVRRALARRALADRLPRVVLEETRRGYQAPDWHERLVASRESIATELARLDECPAAAKALDLARLHRLMDNWPGEGWTRENVSSSYRSALLRGIAVGHFMRRVARSNA